MSLPQISVPTESSTRDLPTAKQWETHKESLRLLYIVQDMTLKKLMVTMQKEYDFYATAKMYKSRFSRWGFVKYNHRKDMEIIARRIVQSGDKNQNEAFIVNGRSVTAQAVAQYFKRRGLKRLEDVVERSTTTVQDTNKGDTSGESLMLLNLK
jgi:hypothetical protein